jgi:RimJ/RimL family protein N-acetyltransferase
MTITTGWDYAGQWVAQEIGKLWHPGAGRALGWLDEEGKLVAGVTFTNFDGTNVWIDCAAQAKTRWLDRRGLYAIFHYVFEQLQCVRCSVMIPENNDKSLKLVRQVGFEYEATLTRAAPEGKDMLVLRMFKEDCRWLSRKVA